MRALGLGLLLLAAPAGAQADLPDAGLPDEAVGQAGAERQSEEEDQGLRAPCLSDLDCDRGFQCVAGTCRWRRWREATFEGCATGGGLWLGGAALLLLRRRGRHFLSNFTK